MQPDRTNIVTGSHARIKKERATQFRQEMTPEETLLWQHLRANRLGGLHFRRQQIIDGFIVDFYCHRAALVVELDGAAHDDPERRNYDAARDTALRQRGLLVLRFANHRARNDTQAMLREIQTAAQQRISLFNTPHHNDPST